ncbi:LacI family DNA-binding transcriptional regulator [Sinorhizobium meliloti]|nr:LacI family DNA-binding transcriptional regulator [Sinorhizobium meliloti]
MKRKLIDVARRAGVGHATVDRVLNERGGVRPETAKRVLDAARDLGFDRKLPTLYRQGLRFEVLLGRRQMPLCARLSDAIVRFGRPFEDIVAIERTFVDETRPELVAEAILKSRGNALVVYGQDHELIIDAIAEVTSAGKPVVTIVSDVPSAPRLSYVGIDHYKAGRCAAFFLAKMAGGGQHRPAVQQPLLSGRGGADQRLPGRHGGSCGPAVGLGARRTRRERSVRGRRVVQGARGRQGDGHIQCRREPCRPWTRSRGPFPRPAPCSRRPRHLAGCGAHAAAGG